jgi:hypothetical protein
VTAPSSIVSLVGRLSDPADRETYAALISYVNSLPKGDELLRLVELLGLVSLVGQRVPAAVAEFLAELRSSTECAGLYHAEIHERLGRLPQQIAAGVNPAVIAERMSEVFRQQLTQTGLEETAALLNAATKTMKALSAEVVANLKPVTQQYRGIATTISTELAKLSEASRTLQQQNAELVVQERSNRWLWQALFALTLFLLGGCCGILLEKRQTTDLLGTIRSQMERVQRSSPASPMTELPKRNRKQTGR